MRAAIFACLLAAFHHALGELGLCGARGYGCVPRRAKFGFAGRLGIEQACCKKYVCEASVATCGKRKRHCFHSRSPLPRGIRCIKRPSFVCRDDCTHESAQRNGNYTQLVFTMWSATNTGRAFRCVHKQANHSACSFNNKGL